MIFFDSHAHYNDEKFDFDRENLILSNYENGIRYVTCNGYNLSSSRQAIELANQFDGIYATVGISPNDIDDNTLHNLEGIEELAKNKKVVAIGEIGLDYYWNKDNKDLQKQIFIEQIKIANKLNLPITIHCRDAHMDLIEILKSEITPIKKGIFHCCPLNVELIKEGLKLGFYISFSGVVTFKNAKPELSVNEVPLDRLLIETDSPYLTPEPYRGTRNDPSKVKYVATRIAQIKGVSVEDIAKCTVNNAKRIYGIG